MLWPAVSELVGAHHRLGSGQARKRRDPGPEPGSVALDPENFLIVPKRTDVAAAGPPDAPNPVLPKEEYLAFRHDWLRWMFKVEPDDLVMEVAVGESMQPTINDGDVLLVHTWEGAPLPPEHGGPCRMITPKLYAWKGAKWIRKIEFLADDHRGFWEERGYSNTAEPWFNDRYSTD